MTQAEMVIKYMKEFGSISTYQAFTVLGIVQLPPRIFYLKREGYQFTKERVNTTNRYGKPTHYDIYKLIGEPNGKEIRKANQRAKGNPFRA